METFRPDSVSGLELQSVQAELVSYHDRPALRLLEPDMESEEERIAILPGLRFKNGIIETEIVGCLRADAPMDMRGFVGIAFRVQPQGSAFECFFLRPTNARADDQLRRNHSTQYISHPEYPWYRLREESPGLYESYTDLAPGEWTKVKIVVSGARAQLYVNGADWPCLIVNDLKLGEIEGGIALWIGTGTEGYFSDIVITPSE
jgi:hypothetical protein